jgi:hypothetical protein
MAMDFPFGFLEKMIAARTSSVKPAANAQTANRGGLQTESQHPGHVINAANRPNWSAWLPQRALQNLLGKAQYSKAS